MRDSAENVLSITLLASLQLRWHDTPWPLPPRRHPHRLLAYLLLTPRLAPIERDALAAILWPDDDLDLSRPRLRLCIHGLTSSLPPSPDGEPWIVREGTLLSWRSTAPCTVDAWEIDRVLRTRDPSFAPDHAADDAASPGSASLGAAASSAAPPARPSLPAARARIAALRAAAALYHGPLLPAFDDEWLAPHRTHYEAAYRAIMAELIDRLEAIGEREEALIVARRLILHDTTDESAHMRVMRQCVALGDRGAALQQFDACLRELAAIGLGPSYALEAMAADIRAGRAQKAVVRDEARAVPVARTAPSDDDTPYVDAAGRVQGLAAVLPRGRLITVTGMCGAGKSRLLRELGRAMRDTWASDSVRSYWHDGDVHADAAHDDGADRPGAIASPAAPFGSATARPPLEPSADAFGYPDTRSLTHQLALTLGLPPSSPAGGAFGRIVSAIGTGADDSAILVVDHIDGQMDAAAALISSLLARCRQLRVVCAAREPLGIPGEITWPVPPLTPAPPPAPARRRAPSEAGDLYTALGGRLPIPLPDREPALRAADAWTAEADGLPLAVVLLANASRRLGVSPPDGALLAAIWSPTVGSLDVRAAHPARQASLAAAYAQTLGGLSPNARALVDILLQLPPPLTPPAVQESWRAFVEAQLRARDAEEAGGSPEGDEPTTPSGVELRPEGVWLDGLLELAMARVMTVTQREGQSTVYALRDGVRRFLGAGARSGTR